ncbi:UNVERIFIED_CONTAM: hypothetical protein Sangu_0406200, partial [Sesamum angustifolium]
VPIADSPSVEVVFFENNCRAHDWHTTHQTKKGSMCHPSDAEAWKYFDWMYPNFIEEPHNVRLGLCTDSFAPHDYGRTYSCWLVIITPYDLPPGICMSFEYMILTIVIPDPSNPKRLIDVYLETLTEELLQLWHVGIRTYDHATSGFHHVDRVDVDCERPTRLWNSVWVEYRRGYGMSVHKEKHLLGSHVLANTSYRHNLDVMHIEKNVVDNILNTVMDIKKKMKDNMNAHRDLKIICNRPELELNEHRPNVMPKAVYTLWKEQKMRVCERIRGLKFSVGYASNLPCYIDMKELRIHGMKSQDYHVFMQKLIPIASHEMFPGHKKVKNKAHVEFSIVEAYIVEEIGTSQAKLYGHELLKCRGPIAEVESVTAYFVNGYSFQTERHNTVKSTMNYGVCVKSSSYTDEKNSFYGIIENIIQLTYPLIPNLHIVLFKCHWVDPVQGMKRVVDDSKWTETIAYESKEVVPVPIVVVDNQSYDICDPNGLQVVLEAAGTSRRGLHENDDENEDEDEDNGGDNETDDEEYKAT